MKLPVAGFFGLIVSLLSTSANAEVCDYRPSTLAGKAVTAVGTSVVGGSVATGVGMQAAGYYTLVHAGSGLTMLGSTAAGASAAGTVGIIGGSAGFIGTAGAILMAPVTIVVGAVTVIGVGAFEGVCFFKVERVTDPYEVREIIESVVLQDDALNIVNTDQGDALKITVLGESSLYTLRKLYIADGELMYRDLGPNTRLGQVNYQAPVASE